MSNRTIARLVMYGSVLVVAAVHRWTGSYLPFLAWLAWFAGLVLMGLLVLRERGPRRDHPKGSGTSLNARWWRL